MVWFPQCATLAICKDNNNNNDIQNNKEAHGGDSYASFAEGGLA